MKIWKPGWKPTLNLSPKITQNYDCRKQWKFCSQLKFCVSIKMAKEHFLNTWLWSLSFKNLALHHQILILEILIFQDNYIHHVCNNISFLAPRQLAGLSFDINMGGKYKFTLNPILTEELKSQKQVTSKYTNPRWTSKL